jgi:hypothetical protein
MDEPQDFLGNRGKSDLEVTLDPRLVNQIQKLHQLTIYGRWLFVLLLWLSIAPWSLWSLRSEIALGRDYFTWVLVRYAIVYNRLPIFALAFCVAMTTAVLVWQTRNILFGLPKAEKQRLQQQVIKISQQGKSHPLWKFIK